MRDDGARWPAAVFLIALVAFLIFVAVVGPAYAQVPLGTYREDNAHASGDWGTLALVVRADVAASICGTDSDFCPLQVDSNGALRVTFSAASVTADTELPAAAALTDNFANPTAPAVGAFLLTWDGSTWDRWDRSVTVASLPLPSGAATSANQTTEITHLATLAGAVVGTEVQVDVITMPTVTVTDGSGALNVIVDSSALPSGASTLAEQQAQTTALQIIDDWDESDRAKVNPIVGQAGVQGAAGASTATTQRVAIATDANVVDRTAVTAANNTGACVTVDTSNDTILASFATRRGATIMNNGAVTVFVKLGATATASSFPLAPGAAYNLSGTSVYTGIIDGITASSSTSVCVWEF